MALFLLQTMLHTHPYTKTSDTAIMIIRHLNVAKLGLETNCFFTLHRMQLELASWPHQTIQLICQQHAHISLELPDLQS